MDRLKSKIKKINWSEVYMATEYIVAIYVALSFLLNLLYIAGIITSAVGVLQPTFYGASLIVVLLLQYGLVGGNKRNYILEKMRPYVAGLAVAGIVSTCNLSLGLLLMLLVGYFLWTGYKTKFGTKEAVLAALVACIGIEICSVAMLLTDNEMLANTVGFMSSAWTDVLFVLVAIAYCVLNRGEAAEADSTELHKTVAAEPDGELLEAAVKAKKWKITGNWQQFDNKYWVLVKGYLAWLKVNSKQVVRRCGEALCVLAMGLFLFYFVSISAGTNKIVNSGEEVYLLQHCEDTSLVLTLVEDKASGTYTAEFQEYTGANNQKVRFEDCGDGLYRLVFVEPQRALEVVLNEKTLEMTLAVNTVAGTFKQYWVKEGYLPEQSMYKLLCAYSVPLSYQMLTQVSGMPEVMVRAEAGGYEFFTLSRTVDDEFATELVWKYGEEFTPSLLTETMLGYMGGWAFVPFLLVVVLFCAIIYARRVLGDKPAVLYALVLAYMLTYASVGAIVLYLLGVGLLCVNAYLSKQAKHKQKAMAQFTGNLTATAKDEMKESLDKMEAALQEMREKLFAELGAMASEDENRRHDETGETPHEIGREVERLGDTSELPDANALEQSVEPDETELDELMGLIDLRESGGASELRTAVDEKEGIEFEALVDEGSTLELDALRTESDEPDLSGASEHCEEAEQNPATVQRGTANARRKRGKKRR